MQSVAHPFRTFDGPPPIPPKTRQRLLVAEDVCQGVQDDIHHTLSDNDTDGKSNNQANALTTKINHTSQMSGTDKIPSKTECTNDMPSTTRNCTKVFVNQTKPSREISANGANDEFVNSTDVGKMKEARRDASKSLACSSTDDTSALELYNINNMSSPPTSGTTVIIESKTTKNHCAPTTYGVTQLARNRETNQVNNDSNRKQSGHIVTIQINQTGENRQSTKTSDLNNPAHESLSLNIINDNSKQELEELSVCINVTTSETMLKSTTNYINPNRSDDRYCFKNFPYSTPTTLMTTSGQCSPSDTLDSGTGSDLDNTPPPLPKKTRPKRHDEYNKAYTRANSTTDMGYVDEGQISNEDEDFEGSSHTSNSSNTSGDSLMSSSKNADVKDVFLQSMIHPGVQISTIPAPTVKEIDDPISLSPEPTIMAYPAIVEEEDDLSSSLTRKFIINLNDENEVTHTPAKTSTSQNELLPVGLLKDIQNSTRTCQTVPNNRSVQIIEESTVLKKLSMTTTPSENDIPRKTPVTKPSLVDESTYEDRKIKTRNEVEEKVKVSEGHYENDCYYSFHLNEKFDPKSVSDKLSGEARGDVKDGDADVFAGVKDFYSGSESIRSAKGTIRGVKNRVRAGIATFLQIQTSNKNYREKDHGKIVVYTTTMGIVRETYQQCIKVKKILRTHLVKFEERDVFMSGEYQEEIRERMQSETILVPQMFIDGQYIGDAEVVERLNESGELRKILKPYRTADACTTCQICGGYRLLPCPVCNGSKKSVHRNHFTTEFVALKCMNCDEVGLVKCYACCS